MNNLLYYYLTTIRINLLSRFLYKNIFQIPELKAIIIHLTVKESLKSSKMLYTGLFALELISGQRPIITKAKKSNASFKLHKNTPIGGKVTLRGNSMYEFLEKLTLFVLPSIKEFGGFNKKGFDGRGNYSFGVKSMLAFPEIEAAYDFFPLNLGLDITFITSAKTNIEGKALLSHFHLPFKN